MKNVLIIAAVVIGLFFLSQRGKTVDTNTPDLNTIKANLAHDLVYVSDNGVKPLGPDDVIPVGPIDPDPNKIPDLINCPLCQGTKIQIHADGHKSPCPYHGIQEEPKEKPQLDTIKRAEVKPQTETRTIKKATYCPCGCRHNVAGCTCRASCPGLQLPAYTYHQVTVNKPVVSSQSQKIVTKSYSNSSSGGRWVCNGRSCTWVPDVQTKQMDQIDQNHQVPQQPYQTQSVMKSYNYQSSGNYGSHGSGRFGLGKGRVRGVLGKLAFWRK